MASEPTTSSDAPASTGGALVTVATVGSMSERTRADLAQLDAELSEIELLITQARAEATRHEQKRVQASDRLPAVRDPVERADLATQLVTLTRRAAVMESQVEVLEGKRKALTRYREGLSALGDGLASVAARGSSGGEGLGGDGLVDATEGLPPAMSRIILGAQEDLRREIARAMHDGPAQSLTNIVLQAQIVERLVARDPSAAAGELRLLVSMVQQTLDATKTFIFDVRPMVLDDLGLVPTLRRAARERGRRAGIPVEFDTYGQDRRIEVDLESSLFRILDEALGAYLAAVPDRVVIRLDWSDDVVEARIGATREPTAAMADADRQVAEAVEAAGTVDKDLPPALEMMIADRRERAEGAVTAAREAAIVSLPADAWREIQQRATTTGIVAELSAGGGELRLRAEIAEPASDAARPAS